MTREQIVKAYAATLRRLRSLQEHYSWCDSADCWPSDDRERRASYALADGLRGAYRTLRDRDGRPEPTIDD